MVSISVILQTVGSSRLTNNSIMPIFVFSYRIVLFVLVLHLDYITHPLDYLPNPRAQHPSIPVLSLTSPGFCDVIPPNCIQMRNLILSAFPRNMRLPDPFTPNLKVVIQHLIVSASVILNFPQVDMLPEISIAPRMVTNFAALIKPSFKKDLDSYLKNRAPVSFLSELRTNLQNATVSAEDAGMRYNISMINALVMYVGTQVGLSPGNSFSRPLTFFSSCKHYLPHL